MGVRNSRPLFLPPPLLPPLLPPLFPFPRLPLPVPLPVPGFPPVPPPFPLGPIAVMIFMLYVEKMIQDIINRRNNENGGVPLLLTKNSYCFSADSSDSSSIPPEIPPECMDKLQNPEALIKSLNIDVPAECMPEVNAALADLRRRGGGGGN